MCRAAYRESVKYRELENKGEIGFRVICYHGLDTWTPPAD